MSFSHIYPVTLRFTQPQVYIKQPLIQRIVEKDVQFIDMAETRIETSRYLNEVVLPMLSFIEAHDVYVNIVISGKLLEIFEREKKPLELLRGLMQKGKVIIAVDTLYGESLLVFHNTLRWLESIRQTFDIYQSIFHVPPTVIYIPQLYRALEMERVVQNTGITTFITRKKGKKPDSISLSLSELRRFDGETVQWILPEQDLHCAYNFISDNLFYTTLDLLLEKNVTQAVKTRNMKMGYNYNKFLLRQDEKRFAGNVRIEEKYSLHNYNHMQRGIIRLWQHESMVISSIRNQEKHSIKLDILSNGLARLQQEYFLQFMDSSLYHTQKNLPFSSPSEAFMTMQSALKEIEIVLKNVI
jgi:hypothetical protein